MEKQGEFKFVAMLSTGARDFQVPSSNLFIDRLLTGHKVLKTLPR